MEEEEKTSSLLKGLFSLGLCFIIIGLIFLRQDDIIAIFHNTFFSGNRITQLEEKNEYYRDYDFNYVQNVEEFYPSNYQDLLNVYYTILNSGQSTVSFYCSEEYSNCIEDIVKITEDEEILSTISNFVHPFNSFSHVDTKYDNYGKIIVEVLRTYSSEQIQMINQNVEEIYQELYNPNSTLEYNIRLFHDYIINHTRYDSDKVSGNSTYHSEIAYGPLFEGYAICGGYTDLMELFLEKLNLKSMKVSSESHVWNAVYLGENWYHLDLTWDDPIASDHKDYLEHSYFLITTDKLLELEKNDHNFSEIFYKELKEA